MKYEGPVDFASGLPDAPLAMPKQILHRQRRPLFSTLRAMFAAALPRF